MLGASGTPNPKLINREMGPPWPAAKCIAGLLRLHLRTFEQRVLGYKSQTPAFTNILQRALLPTESPGIAGFTCSSHVSKCCKESRAWEIQQTKLACVCQPAWLDSAAT